MSVKDFIKKNWVALLFMLIATSWLYGQYLDSHANPNMNSHAKTAKITPSMWTWIEGSGKWIVNGLAGIIGFTWLSSALSPAPLIPTWVWIGGIAVIVIMVMKK